MTTKALRPISAFVAAIILAACATSAPRQLPYDLVIRNGRIVDGTGSPWYRADLGIRGDTIAKIGELSSAAAKQTIDARDQIVAPGFIDLLGWSYTAVLIDPHVEGKIRQGVTTEAGGEGHSPGPINDAMAADQARSGGPDAIPVTWRSLGDFMRVVEKNGSAINFAFFVGASNARSMVIGQVNRAATAAEMKEMEAIIDQAMREGAIGISTSLIYAPAIWSSTDEIIGLARVASRYGGVYFTHLRNENDRIYEALDEAFRIGREANIPVNVWHLKIGGQKNWGSMPKIIERIEEQRQQGLDVAANVYPYTASSTGLTALLPDWSLEGGYGATVARLKDPQQRARIAADILDSAFWGRLGGATGVLISRIPNPGLAQYERKRLDEIATEMNVDPAEAAIRLIEQSPSSPSAIYFSMNEEDVKTALRTWFVSVGSDAGAVVGNYRNAGAHPRAYGTFPRVLGHYVRDEKLFPVEEAVRKMTSQAASRIHLLDRGVLREGMKADVVVFDPATIRDISTYDDPHHFSEGIEDVVVNGVPVLRDGQMTTALPGRVLRRENR